jgi:4-hydroxy-3-polyprenylbenzoate decarboxylase
MPYSSLEACLIDLERHGHLIRVKEEVDPYLEIAAIHEKVFSMDGPALLFENVKGSHFRAASNIFGTLDRSKFIFRSTQKSTPTSVLRMVSHQCLTNEEHGETACNGTRNKY